MSENFDIFAYLMGKQAGGGGGGDITVVSKAISSNGAYTAPTGKAYSPVTVSVPASAVDSGTKSITSNGNNQDVVGYAAVDVAVPNSYAAGDEGKVVSNGALVSQTAHAEVTSNGTIDTTLNNSVVVNVSGGGGGKEFKLETGSFTPASETNYLTITGLSAPAMIVEFAISENATDGTTKLINGLFADGAFLINRTNTNGTSTAQSVGVGNVLAGRTVYNDGAKPTNAIYATKTGFVVGAPNGTYNFKAGYTWNWRCYTYPED